MKGQPYVVHQDDKIFVGHVDRVSVYTSAREFLGIMDADFNWHPAITLEQSNAMLAEALARKPGKG